MKAFRDRLIYDEKRGIYEDGSIRYLMLRPDALMGIAHEMDAAMRPEFFKAFTRSVCKYGKKSAQSYQNLGANQAESLLRVIAETAPQLGWGIWQIEKQGNHIEIQVTDSPFVQGYGASDCPVCAPITGMLEAVGALIFGDGAQICEEECAAMNGGTKCHFSVRADGQ